MEQVSLGAREPLHRDLIQALASHRKPVAEVGDLADQTVHPLAGGGVLHQRVVQVPAAERDIDEHGVRVDIHHRGPDVL